MEREDYYRELPPHHKKKRPRKISIAEIKNDPIIQNVAEDDYVTSEDEAPPGPGINRVSWDQFLRLQEDPKHSAKTPSKKRKMTFDRGMRKLKRFKKKHGNLDVPRGHGLDSTFVTWLDQLRKKFKKKSKGRPSKLSDKQYKKLQKLGFQVSEGKQKGTEFEKRVAQLKKFKREFNHVKVPMGYTEIKGLRPWMIKTRNQFRERAKGNPSDLIDEQIVILNDLGFFWNNKRGKRKGKYDREAKSENNESSHNWEFDERKKSAGQQSTPPFAQRLAEMRAFKEAFNSTYVPQSYEDASGLREWTVEVRKQYWEMVGGCPSWLSDDQVYELNELEFDWDEEDPPKEDKPKHDTNQSTNDVLKGQRESEEAGKEIDVIREEPSLQVAVKTAGDMETLPQDPDTITNGVSSDHQPERTTSVIHEESFEQRMSRLKSSQGNPPPVNLQSSGTETANEILPAPKQYRGEEGRTQALGTHVEGGRGSAAAPAALLNLKKGNQGGFGDTREDDDALVRANTTSKELSSTTTFKIKINSWKAQMKKVKDYKAMHGHMDMPEYYPDDQRFADWFHKQKRDFTRRCQLDETAMSDERFNALQKLGFVVAPIKSSSLSFDERVLQLKDFFELNGHAKVPKNYVDAPGLRKWLSTMRAEFKTLEQEGDTNLSFREIEVLNSLDFHWRGKKARKRIDDEGTATIPSNDSKEELSKNGAAGSTLSKPSQKTAQKDGLMEETTKDSKLNGSQGASSTSFKRLKKHSGKTDKSKADELPPADSNLSRPSQKTAKRDILMEETTGDLKPNGSQGASSSSFKRLKKHSGKTSNSRANELSRSDPTLSKPSLQTPQKDILMEEPTKDLKPNESQGASSTSFKRLKKHPWKTNESTANEFTLASPQAPPLRRGELGETSKANGTESGISKESVRTEKLNGSGASTSATELLKTDKKQDTSWDGRLKQLEEYKSLHGHLEVPTVYETDQAFAIWVRTQRRLFSKRVGGLIDALADDRFNLLKDLGFGYSSSKPSSTASTGKPPEKANSKLSETENHKKPAATSSNSMPAATESSFKPAMTNTTSSHLLAAASVSEPPATASSYKSLPATSDRSLPATSRKHAPTGNDYQPSSSTASGYNPPTAGNGNRPYATSTSRKPAPTGSGYQPFSATASAYRSFSPRGGSRSSAITSNRNPAATASGYIPFSTTSIHYRPASAVSGNRSAATGSVRNPAATESRYNARSESGRPLPAIANSRNPAAEARNHNSFTATTRGDKPYTEASRHLPGIASSRNPATTMGRYRPFPESGSSYEPHSVDRQLPARTSNREIVALQSSYKPHSVDRQFPARTSSWERAAPASSYKLQSAASDELMAKEDRRNSAASKSSDKHQIVAGSQLPPREANRQTEAKATGDKTHRASMPSPAMAASTIPAKTVTSSKAPLALNSESFPRAGIMNPEPIGSSFETQKSAASNRLPAVTSIKKPAATVPVSALGSKSVPSSQSTAVAPSRTQVAMAMSSTPSATATKHKPHQAVSNNLPAMPIDRNPAELASGYKPHSVSNQSQAMTASRTASTKSQSTGATAETIPSIKSAPMKSSSTAVTSATSSTTAVRDRASVASNLVKTEPPPPRGSNSAVRSEPKHHPVVSNNLPATTTRSNPAEFASGYKPQSASKQSPDMTASRNKALSSQTSPTTLSNSKSAPKESSRTAISSATSSIPATRDRVSVAPKLVKTEPPPSPRGSNSATHNKPKAAPKATTGTVRVKTEAPPTTVRIKSGQSAPAAAVRTAPVATTGSVKIKTEAPATKSASLRVKTEEPTPTTIQDPVWAGRLKQLREYHALNGNTRVPTLYEPDQAFSIWVKTQRRLFASRTRGLTDAMSDARFQALQALGFEPKIK